MKCLFVKAPFAGYIVDGVKFVEYRTRYTHIRERIGIIESGTGTVIGDVGLYTCWQDRKHNMWRWILSNARRYAAPFPFEHKKGAVVWINLDIDPLKQAIAPALTIKEIEDAFNAYEKDLSKFFSERRKAVTE